MPLNDLPPWLSGEQDRGFLQGAQLGITAARTGTEIAQTRQQMQESADLQPFRLAAADIANNLQRQQFDLKAALFPLEIQNKALEGQKLGTEIVGQATLNTINIDRLGRIQKDFTNPNFINWNQSTDSKWKLQNIPIMESDEGNAVVVRGVKALAETDAGKAQATALAMLNTRAVAIAKTDSASSLTALKEIANGNYEQAGDILDKADQKQRDLLAQEKLNSSVQLFKEQQKAMEERQLELQKLKNEGMLKAADSRAHKINQSLDVSKRILFEKRYDAARRKGDEFEIGKVLDEFEAQITGATTESPKMSQEESQLAKAKSDVQKDILDFQLKPKKDQDEKTKKVLEEKLDTVDIIILQKAGKVFDPTKDWKGKFQSGEEVVAPQDNLSTNPKARLGKWKMIWPGDDEIQKRLDERDAKEAARVKKSAERKRRFFEGVEGSLTSGQVVLP